MKTNNKASRTRWINLLVLTLVAPSTTMAKDLAGELCDVFVGSTCLVLPEDATLVYKASFDSSVYRINDDGGELMGRTSGMPRSRLNERLRLSGAPTISGLSVTHPRVMGAPRSISSSSRRRRPFLRSISSPTFLHPDVPLLGERSQVSEFSA